MGAKMDNRADVRLHILMILCEMSGYTANQETLIKKLAERGIVLSRDKLHIELAWLDQVADAIVDKVSGGVHIAVLTGDGMDVCFGAMTIPGIRDPRPEEIKGNG